LRRILILMAMLAGGVSVVPATAQATEVRAASLPATLDVVGHGWGHGRGMGQYGDLGYALGGSTYQWILGHFYSGTKLSTTAATTVTVRLDELDNATSATAVASYGQTLYCGGTAVVGPTNPFTSCPDKLLTSSNNTDVYVDGPWSTGSQRAFAGAIEARPAEKQVWNVVGLDAYVEGVVPRESPASWPLVALEAQAVASRSYALAHGAASQPICDTTACQVYGGDPKQYGPQSDYLNSDQAVTSTTADVLLCGTDTACGSATQVALTEFSSSTGGYTAGGAFPAVVDAGDATPTNPNHDWSAQVATSRVQAAFPSVGTLQSILVTGRNGLGDLGGRVTQMLLIGSAGRLTVSGTEFAGALGLKSNWFAITNAGAPPDSDTGYWVVGSNGGVYPFGSAPSFGSMIGHQLNAPVIGMAPTGNGAGYWLVAGDGGIFSFGNAHFYGSTGAIRLNRPVLGMSSTPDSRGYWLVASDGGIFSFGDAHFYGSTGGIRLNKPVVGMSRTGDGRGYWLVASDGGIFTFGDAHFYGSTGNMRLAQPIVGMVPTSDGKGYWLVGRDGGIFTFGDARYVGSLPGDGVHDTIVSVTPTPDGRGYLMVSAGGRVYIFGDGTYFGDPVSMVAGWAGGAIGIFARG
jgi:SpoIID/LytB domain protein